VHFDRFFYPIVEVAVRVNETAPVRITVTNYGSEPADNLSLFITFPYSNFTSISNEFSTSEIMMTNLWNGTHEVPEVLKVKEFKNLTSRLFDPHYLVLDTKKLNHGTGSKAVLALTTEELNWTDFDASAVYDQGSTSWVPAGSLTYKGFMDNILKPGHALAIAMIVGFASSVAVRWHLVKKDKPSKKEIVIVAGIAMAVIFGVLYAIGILNVTLRSHTVAIILIVGLFVLVVGWMAQLNKKKKEAVG
jgi:hypothetical protein